MMEGKKLYRSNRNRIDVYKRQLEPSLYVLYLLAGGERSRWKKAMAAGFTVICLFIPILCVSRFQLIFAVGMAVFTFIAVNHRIRIYQAAVLVCLMIPLYVVLTIARSHDVAYLNGIFEMKNSGMPDVYKRQTLRTLLSGNVGEDSSSGIRFKLWKGRLKNENKNHA